MNEFTASNGIGVYRHIGSDRLTVDGANVYDYLTLGSEQALREFFQHERDEELGRWRYPKDPRYVVYPPDGDDEDQALRILFEPGGGSSDTYTREWLATVADPDAWAPAACTKAYFEAHPERKPWEEAKDGSIWEFDSTQYLADKGRFFRLPLVPPTDPEWRPACFASNFTDGRMVWSPEDAS